LTAASRRTTILLNRRSVTATNRRATVLLNQRLRCDSGTPSGKSHIVDKEFFGVFWALASGLAQLQSFAN
jgi:hypothetical protein